MSQLNLTHGTDKKWEKNRKTEKKKRAMLKSINRQSGECVDSVMKKKREAMVGMICRKGKF